MFRDDPVDVTDYALLNFIHNPYDFKGGYYDAAAQHLIVLLQDCYYEYKRVLARMWRCLNVIAGAMSAEKYNPENPTWRTTMPRIREPSELDKKREKYPNRNYLPRLPPAGRPRPTQEEISDPLSDYNIQTPGNQ